MNRFRPRRAASTNLGGSRGASRRKSGVEEGIRVAKWEKGTTVRGGMSLGVINITDLCNLTHFRSPSATTAARSIFLPSLLLKPVYTLPSTLRSRSLHRSFVFCLISFYLDLLVGDLFVLKTLIKIFVGPPKGRIEKKRCTRIFSISIYGKRDL